MRRRVLSRLSLGVLLGLAIVFVLSLGVGSTSASEGASSSEAVVFADVATELALLEQGEVVSLAGCGFCIALKDTCLNQPAGFRCSRFDRRCVCGFCNGTFDCQRSTL